MSRPSNFITVKAASNALTYAYIGALSLIAIFTYTSHVITEHIMEQQRISAKISYALGTQRTLTQQVTFHARNYHNSGEEVDISLLGTAIDDIEKSQNFIKSSIHEAGFLNKLIGHQLTSGALNKIYYQSPYYLDKSVQFFLKEAKKFHSAARQEANAALPQQRTGFKPEFYNNENIRAAMEERGEVEARKKDFVSNIRFPNALTQEAFSLLAPSLDAALSDYQRETITKINKYYELQLYAMISILALLTLEALLIFRPLVERVSRYNAILRRQAFEDELTGLNNRRAFMEYSNTAINEALANKTPIAVALMDLDKFKSVNDTYGHDVGDLVLQHFSKMLKSFLRSQDIVGRLGGEEFAVVLTETEQGEALKILERLRAKIEKSPCRYKGASGKSESLNYTTSMGICIPKLQDGETSIDRMLKIADEALYEAKEHGRNRITLAQAHNKVQASSVPSSASTEQGKNAPIKNGDPNAATS